MSDDNYVELEDIGKDRRKKKFSDFWAGTKEKVGSAYEATSDKVQQIQSNHKKQARINRTKRLERLKEQSAIEKEKARIRSYQNKNRPRSYSPKSTGFGAPLFGSDTFPGAPEPKSQDRLLPAFNLGQPRSIRPQRRKGKKRR